MAAASALNPNAPVFIPLSYRTVEDFSDQWWDLVQSSPYFRDYWLQECFSDPLMNDDDLVRYEIMDYEEFALINDMIENAANKGKKLNDDDHNRDHENMDLVGLGWMKWRKPRGGDSPRYCEKPPKIVNVARVIPKHIQQPR